MKRLREKNLELLEYLIIATFFKKIKNEDEAAVKVTLRVAHLWAKQGKPFTAGEFITSCLVAEVREICWRKTNSFQTISPSAVTVAQRVETIGSRINRQFKNKAGVGDVAQRWSMCLACQAPELSPQHWPLPTKQKQNQSKANDFKGIWGALDELMDVTYTAQLFTQGVSNEFQMTEESGCTYSLCEITADQMILKEVEKALNTTCSRIC